ncbi:hypothetical protein C7T94_17735 [Pedobacter yulinensis]|uniref:DUF4280 domain-containing protein n=1 Tax=Pedobacter yulinensis TaxID=2126353 RepID=A0A2T3HGY9_9SPHI|nr:DUF4280 domain-containing protein [Pedobacter yulinensis]PST81715.1 hypothetical protein C7T94_17735 [Pedobacter yulinensis]
MSGLEEFATAGTGSIADPAGTGNRRTASQDEMAPGTTFEAKAREATRRHETKHATLERCKLVIDGAKLHCPSCTRPQGSLSVLEDTPTTQNKRTATTIDRSPASVQFEGNCLKSPNASLPCKGVIQLGSWQETGTMLVQNRPPLLLKSTVTCLYGGSVISITDCGQRREVAGLETRGAPLPLPQTRYRNGYYYLENGSFVASIADAGYPGAFEDVYICKKIADPDRSKDIDQINFDTISHVLDEGVPFRHADFSFIAYVIAHEAGGADFLELSCLAFASHNEAMKRKLKANRWKTLLNTGYSSVMPKGRVPAMSTRTLHVLSRKAIFRVLTGKDDPTSGATFWDGTDFLAHGNSELKPNNKIGSNKFDEYKFIEIPGNVYRHYAAANTQKYVTADKGLHTLDTDRGNHSHITKTVKKKRLDEAGTVVLDKHGKAVIDSFQQPYRIAYPVPAADFSDENNWSGGHFYYLCDKTKGIGISATIAAGKSIFWKTTRVRLFTP